MIDFSKWEKTVTLEVATYNSHKKIGTLKVSKKALDKYRSAYVDHAIDFSKIYDETINYIKKLRDNVEYLYTENDTEYPKVLIYK